MKYIKHLFGNSCIFLYSPYSKAGKNFSELYKQTFISQYDFKKFAILNVASAGVWALVFGLGSSYSGSALVKFAQLIGDKPWIAPIVLVVFGGSLWLYLETATKKKKK